MLTIDEIKSAVEKQPDLKTGLISSFKDDFVQSGESLGLVIRTKEDDQSYLTNYTNTAIDGEVSKRLKPAVDIEFGKALNKIDAEIQAITGIPKNNGEKTTDYAKRALASKVADPVTKDKLIEIQNQLTQKDQDHQKQLSELNTKLETRELEFQIDSALLDKQFPLPAHLKTDEEKANYRETQKRLIKQDFIGSYQRKKDNDGNLVFYKGEQPQMSTKDGKPKGAKDLIEESYGSFFIQPGKQATGTGQSQNGEVPKKGEFKGKDDLHRYLAASGVEAGTGEYLKQLESLAKESNIAI